jgi:hypothetical protein
MRKESAVTTVRRLLAEARVPDPAEMRRRSGPLGTVRRKFLIQQAKLTASRFSLQDHLDAFVYASGHEALTGLDLDQLEQLVSDLDRLGASVEGACDPVGVPPAR